VNEDERPLFLLVSADPDRLARVREVLRGAGLLTAGSRSLPAAANLLTQVKVDGCVLCDAPGGGEAEPLLAALLNLDPAPVRICLKQGGGPDPVGWSCCQEAELAARVRALLKRV